MSRVVVIDDYEPTLRMYAAAIEKMLGGEVVPFSDPREALHYLNGMDPTLCVVDYSMPDMDGVEFVQELRGVPGRERTPIIMLTGKDDRELKNRALDAGVNVFLNKPVTAEEFASHVRRLATQQNVQNSKSAPKVPTAGCTRAIAKRSMRSLAPMRHAIPKALPR
jgi:PleD family two-component response regulator